MPTLRIREVRLPELHLPEMSRDDISRAFDGARRDLDLSKLNPKDVEIPEIDLTKVEVPKIDLSKVEVPKIDLTKIDLPKVDLTKAVVAATTLGRTSRRPRLPFVLGGLITLGLVGYALMTSPTVRPKLEDLGRRIRQRIEERRAMMQERAEHDPIAFDAAVAVPIQPSAYASSAPGDGSPFDGSSDLPDGLGEDVAHEAPAAYAAIGDETTAYESTEARSEV
jgi:hypothetical protein